jgi:nucleoside-diphosphate-sugar epimerase
MLAGALGEVGRTVGAALRARGHDVLEVSSRAPLPDRPDVLPIEVAVKLVPQVDAVVNCSGRGDRRGIARTGELLTQELARASARSGVRSVLISTTRVLEGYDGEPAEDAPPRPVTEYAAVNAENEALWSRCGGGFVLRITNYFAPPGAIDSPQAQLLPWSLVTEALSTGRISIRSGRALRKEFVSAADVASAAVALIDQADTPITVATAPGLMASLGELADACARAMVLTGRPEPAVSFGPDGPQPPVTRPGWLAAHGWQGQLSLDEITDIAADWIRREAGAVEPGA